jgi:uridine kinase
LEGGLLLTQPKIVELLTESIFLDTAEPIRLQRRLRRDYAERGQTREGILAQFYHQVKPIHDHYVALNKSLATYCIANTRSERKAIVNLIEKLGVDS